jgi:FMN reductase
VSTYAREGVTRRLAVVSAGLSTPSSTRLLADRLAEATTAQLAAEGILTEMAVLDLRDHAMAVTSNLLSGFASPELEAAIESLTGADGAIFSTPIFTTSYSGLFKSFIDVLEPGSLAGLPVVIGATGGTERHSLALDYAIRPLFTYHHAIVTPTGVYAATGDWGSPAGPAGNASLPDRINRAAAELAALMRDSTRSHQVRDPFALPAGFSPTGSR